jgi:hypothetical protein
VLASLALLDLVPDGLAFASLGTVYRAPLGSTDYSLHFSGPSGGGKSELLALLMQHFGAGLDARSLTSWKSTENAIEGQAFQAKDQILGVDDFAPAGSSHDVLRSHRKADRIFRGKGNNSGRQRMRADATLRPDRPPRATIASTGEDVPRGQSLRARMLVLELDPDTMDWPALTARQRDAGDGLYALSMAGYVRSLAGRYGGISAGLRDERAALREAARAHAQHRRTPGIVADVALGLRYFLRYACDTGAIDAERAEELWARGWLALGSLAADQRHHQAAGEPTQRFAELLSAAIVSGRAHVASPSGDEPWSPGAWGWRSATVGTGDHEREEWRCQGKRVGWLEDEDLYLEPDASYAAAQEQGRDSGDALTVTGQTLRKRLHQRKLLASTDDARQTLTVRRSFEGSAEACCTPTRISSPPLAANPTNPTRTAKSPSHTGIRRRRSGRVAKQNPTTSPTKTRPRAQLVGFPNSPGRVLKQNPTSNPSSKKPIKAPKTLPMVGLVGFRCTLETLKECGGGAPRTIIRSLATGCGTCPMSRAATFVEAELRGVEGMRYREMLGRWLQEGGDEATLTQAVGAGWTKRRESDGFYVCWPRWSDMSSEQALRRLVGYREWARFFKRLCESGPKPLSAQAWQFRDELAERGANQALADVEDALFDLARSVLPESPVADEAVFADWACSLWLKAIRYAAGRWGEREGAPNLTDEGMEDLWGRRGAYRTEAKRRLGAALRILADEERRGAS